jgi:hypothetical protein
LSQPVYYNKGKIEMLFSYILNNFCIISIRFTFSDEAFSLIADSDDHIFLYNWLFSDPPLSTTIYYSAKFRFLLRPVSQNLDKVPNDRLVEIRKDKAMRRLDIDDLWTKIETLQWVLYVIFAIKNKRMVVI